MSDGDALLAAIAAHPDEDTPRLAYADWLDEHGDPARAEFIRLQCLPHPTEDAVVRAGHLEDQHRGRWLLGMPHIPTGRWEFRRGFPDRLVVEIQSALEQFEALARAPWLRSLSIWGCDNGTVRDFVSRPWNARWDELTLEEDLNADGMGTINSVYDTEFLVAVAACPAVARLRRLELRPLWLTSTDARALADSPHLAGLERLTVGGIGGDRTTRATLLERFGDRLVIADGPPG